MSSAINLGIYLCYTSNSSKLHQIYDKSEHLNTANDNISYLGRVYEFRFTRTFIGTLYIGAKEFSYGFTEDSHKSIQCQSRNV